ncbi:MAG: nucleoside-diphosphate sugar epimerase/dehydratase [Parvularculaceae bacterium]
MLKDDGATAFRRSGKHLLLLGLDVTAAIAALAIASVLTAADPMALFTGFLTAIPVMAVSAAIIFYFVGLSKRFWRFFSIVDLTLLLIASGVLSASGQLYFSTVAPMSDLPTLFFPLHWIATVALMSVMRAARRFAPKIARIVRARRASVADADAPAALIAGTPDCVEFLLRQRAAGLAGGFRPVGVIIQSNTDYARTLRGVPILGSFSSLPRVAGELKGGPDAPEMLVIAASRQAVADNKYVALASKAEAAGLATVRASMGGAVDEPVALREFDMSALLGRPPAKFDAKLIARAIEGRRVLVTGAGGSIGGELVRQIASFKPARIALVELSEYNLYKIDHELRTNFPHVEIEPILCDVCDRTAVMDVFAANKPDVVFHAAALKHVPLVEHNSCAGAATNVLGTKNVADAARRHKATAMVQVSTDKAVNPVGMMGATKRLGELYCQALDLECANDEATTRFMTVRFGNVLGSSGSVVPLFQRQLKERTPLTVTHPEMNRFFMTIHEAVSLILQSTQGAFEHDARRGRIFVLDMGDPVKIVDIAERMIRLSGLEPNVDVKIEFIGLRPGEKLFEELFDKVEDQLPSSIPGVFEAEPAPIPLAELERAFEDIAVAVDARDADRARERVFAVLEGRAFDPSMRVEAALARGDARAHATGIALASVSPQTRVEASR